jgi:ABC-2 type transport system ATP-binding protein
VLELAVDTAGPEAQQTLRRSFPAYRIDRPDERRLRVVSSGPIDLLPLAQTLAGYGTRVQEARLLRPTLEEVFVRVTGIESGQLRQEREGKKR